MLANTITMPSRYRSKSRAGFLNTSEIWGLVMGLSCALQGLPRRLGGKEYTHVQETWVWSLGWGDPFEKEMATHSSTLAWKIQRTEESGRLQSMVSQRVRLDWAAEHACALKVLCHSRVLPLSSANQTLGAILLSASPRILVSKCSPGAQDHPSEEPLI